MEEIEVLPGSYIKEAATGLLKLVKGVKSVVFKYL
jgi:hypothetical protein